ncbi:MAG: MFS transporter [Candidatus Actinomarina sp.]|tara:strand:+ start:1831 stop:3012 length:1182 start_codon:yes stop_codon:yes gene_type:complete
MISESRKISGLLLSVAFSSIGFIAAITVTVLAAREVSSNPLFLGFPNAVGVGGAFIGTQMFYKISKKYSRLAALSITFFIGAIGSVVLFYSLIIDSFTLLMIGALILGFGQSATLQSRYAASFVASKNFKATALSLAVWFSVFGSVFGPRLVSLYSEYFNELFNSELIVGYIVAMVGMLFASASVITFTSSNSLLRKPAETEENNVQKLSNTKKDGNILTLLLVLNHFTMVVIMSATPLHVQDIGETVQLVGVIISYHTLGMFLLSPILGNYVDRYGYRRFTYIGTGILFISCLITFINSGPTALKIGLYLLGLGWNFNYVAISSAISKFSIKYKSPLNIKSDSFVFLGSFTAHMTLGLSYLLIGYRGLVTVGMLVSLYLFLNLKNLKKLDIE